jgi:F-type H+-transporting ATPase subunit delta
MTADFIRRVTDRAGCFCDRGAAATRKRAKEKSGAERGHVSESASISTGIAARYATAVFGLAKDGKKLDALERDIDTLDAAISQSADFRDLIHSPIYTRKQQGNAVAALADKMGLTDIVANTLKLMASKRRLFVLPQLVVALRGLIADEKGEVTADIRAARALSDDQKKSLAETLKASIGKDVKMNVAVDESLIGGLIVKVGSKMIDTSIRSKLAALQNTMKEVG